MELELVIEKMQTDQDVKNVQQALKLFYLFDKAILKTKKIQIKDTILLVGSPRSGTTWLMEIFESIPEYTNLFEPFNPIFFPEISRFGFSHKPYVPVNASWPDCENYLKRVFTGRIYTLLPQYKLNLETIMHRLTNKKLVVKAINLNRLLPWIVNKFQIRNSYFIIRHPCAVIASQLKTGFCGYHSIYPPYINMFPTKDQIIQEANNIDFLDKKILAKLNKIKTIEEILAAAWCLDSIVPLSVKKPYPWTTIVYEKLDGLNTFEDTLPAAMDADVNDTHEYFGVMGDDPGIDYEVDSPVPVTITNISNLPQFYKLFLAFFGLNCQK